MEHKVTSGASQLILREKRAGKSSRDIAKKLLDELGVTLDQRTISRHVARIEGKAQKRAPEPAPTPKVKPRPKARPERTSTERVPIPSSTGETTLDEVEALERQVLKLQVLLEEDLPPKDRAALTGELRQTFASIRKAVTAKKQLAATSNSDAEWVLAKLRRFDAMNRGAEAPVDDGAVPEAAGAANGE